MITLKKETKENLRNLLGLRLSELDKYSVPEEIAYLEQQSGKKISFSKARDSRKIGRGNPLLARRRIRTIDEVNKRLDKMKW